MAEQQLNGADIGAGFQQMNREGMAQRMRRDRLGEVGAPMCLLTSVFDGISRDRLARVTAREEPVLRAHGLPVAAQDIQQLRREHDVAILLAFALLDADDHPPAVDGGGLQANGFRDSQAGSVTGGQDHAMLASSDTAKEV